MSELKRRLNDDVKTALKARDKPRVGTLRLILAAIKQREVDERIELDDVQILAVLDKMSKQRRESIEHYRKAERADLVDQESLELDIIADYMPQPLSDAELDACIAAAFESSAATTMKDMGKVMGLLKPQLLGRADMGAVSAKVKSRLG